MIHKYFYWKSNYLLLFVLFFGFVHSNNNDECTNLMVINSPTKDWTPSFVIVNTSDSSSSLPTITVSPSLGNMINDVWAVVTLNPSLLHTYGRLYGVWMPSVPNSAAISLFATYSNWTNPSDRCDVLRSSSITLMTSATPDAGKISVNALISNYTNGDFYFRFGAINGYNSTISGIFYVAYVQISGNWVCNGSLNAVAGLNYFTNMNSDITTSGNKNGADYAYTVWYTFSTNRTGNLSIVIDNFSPAGGNKDTVLFIYSGTCNSLIEVGFNDDASMSDKLSTISIQTTNDTTQYYIVIGSKKYNGVYVAGNGTFNLNFKEDENGLTTSMITSSDITTSIITTARLTTASMSTASVTTHRLTTSRLTTKEMTTKAMTSSPLTTKELTSSPLTTKELTSSPLTTKEMTSSPLTTQELTTNEMTSNELTTNEVTTNEWTTQELTTYELSTQELTTQELTTQELTTNEITTQELSTSVITTSEITSAEIEVTSSKLTTSLVMSYELTTAATVDDLKLNKKIYPVSGVIVLGVIACIAFVVLVGIASLIVFKQKFKKKDENELELESSLYNQTR